MAWGGAINDPVKTLQHLKQSTVFNWGIILTTISLWVCPLNDMEIVARKAFTKKPRFFVVENFLSLLTDPSCASSAPHCQPSTTQRFEQKLNFVFFFSRTKFSLRVSWWNHPWWILLTQNYMDRSCSSSWQGKRVQPSPLYSEPPFNMIKEILEINQDPLYSVVISTSCKLKIKHSQSVLFFIFIYFFIFIILIQTKYTKMKGLIRL